jgi:signal transduction histidine kinase
MDEPDVWQFSIADNGMGITLSDQTRIFELFETLTSLDNKSSMGLGLSLVKKVVERYGGRIWVESDKGRGSTFRFTICKSLPIIERGFDHAGNQAHSSCGR